MAHICTKIKIYLDREVDFTTEVILKNDADGIIFIEKWDVDKTQPTIKQLDALESEGNDYEALALVLSSRITAYPTWQEQLDMQYHDQLDGTTTWKDAVAKVKSDNPKE